MKYTLIESKAAYTVQSLMCDVGGSLGLIIGATILTFCEVVDFLFQLSFLFIRARSPAVADVVGP